jgi:hypothetical protein
MLMKKTFRMIARVAPILTGIPHPNLPLAGLAGVTCSVFSGIWRVFLSYLREKVFSITDIIRLSGFWEVRMA